MKAGNYFYATAVKVANAQGFTIQSLAKICNLSPGTMAKHLKRDNSELTSWEAYLIQQAIAPYISLDELYPEADLKNNHQ